MEYQKNVKFGNKLALLWMIVSMLILSGLTATGAYMIMSELFGRSNLAMYFSIMIAGMSSLINCLFMIDSIIKYEDDITGKYKKK